MNSEQILLLVAAVGVMFLTVMGALGSNRKRKNRAQEQSSGVLSHAHSTRANRAQRRKKR